MDVRITDDREEHDEYGARDTLDHILHLVKEIHQMSQDMTASQTALDAAITKVADDVTTLLTAVAAIPGAQDAVTAEIAALQASTAALTSIDTSVNPAPVEPPAA